VIVGLPTAVGVYEIEQLEVVLGGVGLDWATSVQLAGLNADAGSPLEESDAVPVGGIGFPPVSRTEIKQLVDEPIWTVGVALLHATVVVVGSVVVTASVCWPVLAAHVGVAPG
jgi:hypothetical protein